MRGLGSDHVISGPMRSLGKKCIQWRTQTDKHTGGHGNSKTESSRWADLVKMVKTITIFDCVVMFNRF